MKPKFKNVRAWEQAQLLMQPSLIRVLDNIRKQLEKSNWKGTYEDITEPFPGYKLLLTRGKYSVEIDVWELCFLVCFQDYQPSQAQDSYEVEIDTNLIDEAGEVDWQLLETKSQHIVSKVFADLPHNS